MIKQVKVFPVKPLRESVAEYENGPAFACRAVNYYENRNYVLLSPQLPSPHESYDHSAYNLLHNAQYVTWRNVIRFHHCEA